jgi:flagellin
MSQAQILTSAATSVLAQANSMPQAILKLLQ